MMRRSAFTLIETIGMVAIVGTLLSTSALIINRSFNTHRAALEHLRKMRGIEQFVDRWRWDVQSCSKVTITNQLELTMNEELRLQYSATVNTITRTKFLHGEQVGQEVWELPIECRLKWAVEHNDATHLLVGQLSFIRPADDAVGIEMEPFIMVSRIGIGPAPAQSTSPPQPGQVENGKEDQP
jgi:hypothetical protein